MRRRLQLPAPPPPLRGLGGLGPEGGGNERQGLAPAPERWQLQGQRGWEGPRRAREGRAGGSRTVSRSPPHKRAPSEGDQSHKASIARTEGSKPRRLESGPPLPRGLPARPEPGKPPSLPGPVPGADGGRERWGGEGRSPRGPSSAASLGPEQRRPKGLGEGARERKE